MVANASPLFPFDLRVDLEAVAQVTRMRGGDEAEAAELVESAECVGEREFKQFEALRGDDGAAVGAGRGGGVGEAGTTAEVELVMTAAGATRDDRSAARSAIGEAVDTCRYRYLGYIHPRGGVVFKFFRLCRLQDSAS